MQESYAKVYAIQSDGGGVDGWIVPAAVSDEYKGILHTETESNPMLTLL